MANLLAWRDIARKRSKRNFLIIFTVFLLGCIFVTYLWQLILVDKIQVQKSAAESVHKKILSLNMTNAGVWFKRTKYLVDLRKQQLYSIYLFKNLVAIIPSNIYLTEFSKAGNKITLIGIANTNQDITTLLNNIKQSKLLKNPKLQEIKTGMNNTNQFILICNSNTKKH